MQGRPNRFSWARWTAALLAGALALAVFAASAEAQDSYFGRNKVQYDNFDWRVLHTQHFDIYFYSTERASADLAARMAERWYTRHARLLHHELSGRQPLILYATQAQFQQTNVVGGIGGEGTGGVTEALRRRIVLPTGGTLGDLDHVIGHELTHAFQYDMTGGPGGVGGLPRATALPLWFIEGMAEYFSLGPISPLTAMWMRGSIQDSARDSLPTFNKLDDPRYFPYRYGQALLAYIAGTYGDDKIGQLLTAGARSRSMDQAIRAVLKMAPDSLIARWHAATHAAYDPLRPSSELPDRYGPKLVGVKGEVGQYNVAPALSPDGSEMMFFSDRGLFSVDLYLADAHTGKVKRQITRTAVDAHLESLQFIQSAGSWSPDGKRFVFAAVSDGRPVLDLYDVAGGRTEREIKLKQLGEVLNPSWSPDGRSIAFAAVVGGLTDLYLYDLAADSLHRLTNDPFADLQPAWSPDGRSLAFMTDRFTTRLADLAVGRYTLGVLDLATGRIVQVPGFPGAKHINPQWSPDGGSLYFLSDPDGITNVYRVRLADGALRKVTNLFTGASGITETSPALAVAEQDGRMVYSVFRTNGYELYGIDDAMTLAGAPAPAVATQAAGVLPPPERGSEQLVQQLKDPDTGLPAHAEFAVERYRPKLSLTYVGQPSLIAGSSQFGTYVGGGASLYFSDELGNHNLITGLQINGGLKDITALVGYQNLSHRLNWALVAEQVPFATGAFAEGLTTINGEPAVVDQQLIDRQTNRDFQALLAYPFSTVQRLEFSAGYTNISFDSELRTQAFSAITGEQLVDTKENLPAGRDINLGVGSAALVFDNSLFGATGPILGQRYRLEASPAFGSLDFVGALADYRRYFMPARPVTLAVRLLHYGRYGRDGEDPRLQPLFLGYSGLVRGYQLGSFDASECHPTSADPNGCPVFDQLLGSRMVVGNAELRLPLFGALGVGSGYYGALPIDFFVFGDAGVAWDTSNEPKITGGDRPTVYSAGTGLRMNLFGFAIAELDLVHPFERPGRNWVWELNLQPGF